MTEQERIAAFQNGVNELLEKYGFSAMKVEVQSEQLGDAVLIKPFIRLIAIPDWQESKIVSLPKAKR